jgi:aspartate aminotransferase
LVTSVELSQQDLQAIADGASRQIVCGERIAQIIDVEFADGVGDGVASLIRLLEMLMFLLQLSFDGDIVVPTPSWVSYVPQARLAGRTVVRVAGGGRHGLMFDGDDLRRACAGSSRRPRLLFLNSPSNPTGLAFTADELAGIAAVSRDLGLTVLSDEIYGELTFAGSHRSIASLYPEGTIVASGLSKWCGAGGWRLGTLALPASMKSLRRALEAVASETFSSTSAPIQHAAVCAFRPDGEIEDYLATARRILSATLFWAATRLSAAGLLVPEAAAGFYLFPGFEAHRGALEAKGVTDDVGLVDRLLTRTGIVSVPGSAFGLDPRALRVRLALVDFDGAHAMRAAAGEVIDHGFLRRQLAPVWAATEALVGWCDELSKGAG